MDIREKSRIATYRNESSVSDDTTTWTYDEASNGIAAHYDYDVFGAVSLSTEYIFLHDNNGVHFISVLENQFEALRLKSEEIISKYKNELEKKFMIKPDALL